MILFNSYNVGNFIYCAAYFSPNERWVHRNSGDGHYHQYVYADPAGTLTAVNPTTDEEITFTKPEGWGDDGFLIDFSERIGWDTITTTADKGITAFAFNPLPANRELSVEIVKGIETRTITATDVRVIIVAIFGKFLANDKEVKSLQHIKLLPGNSAVVTSNADTVYAIVTSDE